MYPMSPEALRHLIQLEHAHRLAQPDRMHHAMLRVAKTRARARPVAMVTGVLAWFGAACGDDGTGENGGRA